MQFKIKSQEDPEITIWLEDHGSRIILKGKDSNGRIRSIMSFRDGKFFRYDVTDLKGLETEGEGNVIKEEE